MIKNIIILALTALVVILSVLLHNESKPLCDDLVRYPQDASQQLVCERGLGNIQEDEANVRIRDDANYRQIYP